MDEMKSVDGVEEMPAVEMNDEVTEEAVVEGEEAAPAVEEAEEEAAA